MSRPCPSCLVAIKDMGIKHIYYTTDDGFAYEQIIQEKIEKYNWQGGVA